MEAASARLHGAPAEPAPQRALDRLRSDRRLADRYRAGDEAAFARLYERHRARVFAICLGVLGSREDAQDALQEVFASVAAELRREPPRELRPWIARVARNAAIDFARTRRPASNGDEGSLDSRASDGTLQAVESRDDIRDLLVGLRDLPEQQRTALVMRELGGDSYSDIGAALGVDETAVRGLIARARLSLRARIAAQAMACEVVRQRLAAETDGRRRQAPVRRHLRECDSCRAFGSALKADARTIRGLAPTGVGFGVLALITAWRAPKVVVAGGLIAKGAVSSGAAQVAVVCVAALCAAGGAEQLVEQQRDRSHDSASARASSLAATESAGARATLPAVGGSAASGGAALLPVLGALDRARTTTGGPAAAKTKPTTTAPTKPARRPASGVAPADGTRPSGREVNGGGVERLRDPWPQRGDGDSNGGGGQRSERPSSDRGGDDALPQRAPSGSDGPQGGGGQGGGADRQGVRGDGEGPRGGGGGNRTPSLGGAVGGVTPPVVPQVTAPVPEEAPVPATDGDGS
jgi:RNA polymerase sigma factor (sigma-70 family)